MGAPGIPGLCSLSVGSVYKKTAEGPRVAAADRFPCSAGLQYRLGDLSLLQIRVNSNSSSVDVIARYPIFSVVIADTSAVRQEKTEDGDHKHRPPMWRINIPHRNNVK